MSAKYALSMLQVLKDRLYRIFFFSFTLGNFVEGMLAVTAPFLVLQSTGSPAKVGLVLASQTLGVLCAVLLSGTLADRFPKVKIIYIFYILGALSLIPIFLFELYRVNAALMALCLFAFGASTAIYGPLSDSLTPDLVQEENLHRANSLDSLSQRIGQGIAGPIMGGLLVSLGTGKFAYILSAVSLLVAALLMRNLHIATIEKSESQEETASWKGTLQFIKGWPVFLLLLTWVSLAVMLQVGGKPVVNTFLADSYHNGSLLYGSALAVGSLASLAASITVGAAELPNKYQQYMVGCWSVGSLAILPLIFSKNIIVFFLTFIVSSALLTVGNVYWSTFVQKSVPRKFLSRVISIDWFFSLALVPLGAALTGFMLGQVAVDQIILGISLPIFLGGVLLLLLMKRNTENH